MMPLTLFIVVGLGALSLVITRMGAATMSAAVRESVSVQALLAAESGGQYGMNQLLFDVSSRSEVATNCANLNGDTVNYSVVGLQGCSVSLSCASVNNSGGSADVYRIEATGTCGGGDLYSQRVIAIAASYE